MVGRRMMGRVGARLCQAAPLHHTYADRYDLGGLSFIGVGDPAQCEAMCDEQLYDVTPHKDTKDNSDAARLSNRGLNIYSQFTEVIVLTACHRLRTIDKETLTPDEQAYNDRAERFLQILHRLRDLAWTPED